MRRIQLVHREEAAACVHHPLKGLDPFVSEQEAVAADVERAFKAALGKLLLRLSSLGRT